MFSRDGSRVENWVRYFYVMFEYASSGLDWNHIVDDQLAVGCQEISPFVQLLNSRFVRSIWGRKRHKFETTTCAACLSEQRTRLPSCCAEKTLFCTKSFRTCCWLTDAIYSRSFKATLSALNCSENVINKSQIEMKACHRTLRKEIKKKLGHNWFWVTYSGLNLRIWTASDEFRTRVHEFIEMGAEFGDRVVDWRLFANIFQVIETPRYGKETRIDAVDKCLELEFRFRN